MDEDTIDKVAEAVHQLVQDRLDQADVRDLDLVDYLHVLRAVRSDVDAWISAAHDDLRSAGRGDEVDG